MPSASCQVMNEKLELLGDSRSEQFEQLYVSSRARVYSLAARVVGNPDDAADITQEVFLRAYVNHPQVSEWEHPESWLYKVTMNACYDHLRRRKTRTATSLEDVGELVAQHDGFAASEMTQAIESALAKLSVRYRTAILLRDLYGLETGEISAALGVSSATTRVVLHRARRAFRKSLEHSAPGASTTLSGVGLAVLLPDLAVPAGLALPALSGAAGGISPFAPLTFGGLVAKIAGLVSFKAAAVAATAVVLTGGGAAYMAIHATPDLPVRPEALAVPADSAVVPPPPAERAGLSGGSPQRVRAAGETARGEKEGQQSGTSVARMAGAQRQASPATQRTRAGVTGGTSADAPDSTLRTSGSAGAQTSAGAQLGSAEVYTGDARTSD